MLPLSGMAGRIANAVLYGVIVFIVVYIIGVLIGTANVEIADLLKKWSAFIGLLAGLVVFFTGNRPA